MVEDELTDGQRIAELLASELAGLNTGPLAGVAIVDADREVEPTPEGALAYRIEFGDERVGEVRIRPDAALVVLSRPWPPDDVGPGLRTADEALVVERGASVKGAVDAIRDALAD